MRPSLARRGLLRSAWEALSVGRVNRAIFLLQRAGIKKPLTDTERNRFNRLHQKLVRRADLLACASTARALR